MSDVLSEANNRIEKELAAGKKITDILSTMTLEYYKKSKEIVFNGDGYSDDWVKEAESRGLPNLRTTPEALAVYLDKDVTSFLSKQDILRENEIETRYNVLIESYNTWREIEFETLITMVEKCVLPSAFGYKETLAKTISQTNSIGEKSDIELEILRNISHNTGALYSNLSVLKSSLEEISKQDEAEKSHTIAAEIMPITEEIANLSNKLETMIPDQYWTLPTYFDMLFLR
jgi:glutamine synthetase